MDEPRSITTGRTEYISLPTISLPWGVYEDGDTITLILTAKISPPDENDVVSLSFEPKVVPRTDSTSFAAMGDLTPEVAAAVKQFYGNGEAATDFAEMLASFLAFQGGGSHGTHPDNPGWALVRQAFLSELIEEHHAIKVPREVDSWWDPISGSHGGTTMWISACACTQNPDRACSILDLLQKHHLTP
jgi:hypothetical protein